MVHLFLEQSFNPPMSVESVRTITRDRSDCCIMHNVHWCSSLLTADGRKMVCQFQSPDMESVRTALREVDVDTSILWPGTIHENPGLIDSARSSANVLVSRHFKEPVLLEDVQAKEDAGAWCLEAHNVLFILTYFSVDRTRMLCLYCAPDAESVRLAQTGAGMVFDSVRSFTKIAPAA